MDEKLENQPLQIADFTFESDARHCRSWLREKNQTFNLHPAYGFVLTGLKSAKTLKELALWLFENRIPFRFSGLVAMVQTLCRNGFILNSGLFIERLYELREEHAWDPPLPRQKSYSLKFSSFQTLTPSSPVVSWGMAALLFTLGVMAGLDFFPHQMEFLGANWVKAAFWSWTLSSFIFCALGLIEALFSAFFRGIWPQLQFELTPLGGTIGFERWFYYDGKREGLASFVQISLAFFYFFLAKVGLSFLSVSPSTSSAIQFVLLLIFWIEFSPVSKTRLSEAIKLAYQGRMGRQGRRLAFSRLTTVALLFWGGGACVLQVLFWQSHPLLHEGVDARQILHLQGIALILISALFLSAIFRDLFTVMKWFFTKIPIEGIWSGPLKRTRLATENLQVSLSVEEVFEQFGILRNLHPSLKKRMRESVRVIRVPKGGVVCTEGQSDRKMYGVIRGRLGIYRKAMAGNRFIVDLVPGALFGEVSFFKGTRRTASVMALEECELLEIRYQPGATGIELSDEFFKPLQDRIWLAQALVASSVFQGLPLETMDQILMSGKVSRVQPGFSLTTQGEIGTHFFLIIQGQARVEIDGKLVRVLGRGDIVGELALLLHQPRSSTVIANNEVEILAIKREDFWRLLAGNWGLGLNLESASSVYYFGRPNSRFETGTPEPR